MFPLEECNFSFYGPWPSFFLWKRVILVLMDDDHLSFSGRG